MYVSNMKKLLQKILVELPKKISPREKLKSLLHAIGGGWYVNKLGKKLPPLKKRKFKNKSPKEEEKIKIKLTEANKYFNYWKFQIHWNKLEWLNPRSRDEQKNPFCVSSKKKHLR